MDTAWVEAELNVKCRMLNVEAVTDTGPDQAQVCESGCCGEGSLAAYRVQFFGEQPEAETQ